MDIKQKIIIDELKEELEKFQKPGPGQRFSKNVKNKVRLLHAAGMTISEINYHLPISTFSIREWTKENSQETEAPKPFRQLVVTESSKIKFTIRHSSGFYIEVNDMESLQQLLLKIKSL